MMAIKSAQEKNKRCGKYSVPVKEKSRISLRCDGSMPMQITLIIAEAAARNRAERTSQQNTARGGEIFGRADERAEMVPTLQWRWSRSDECGKPRFR